MRALFTLTNILYSAVLTFPIFFISMILMYIPGAQEIVTHTIVPGLTVENLIGWILATPVQVCCHI